jgi:hypothetical protein
MTTGLRRLLLTAAFLSVTTAAGAQTLSPLTQPAAGAQTFTYSCSVSGCATGTVVAAFAPTQNNALLSATNGIFANLLQGNAVLSASNPLFMDIVSCAAGVCGLPTVTGNALVQGAITTPMTGTTATTLITAVTSQRIYVNSISCQNTSSTGTMVQITDGSGGTVRATLAAGPTFGGDNRNGGAGPLFETTAGNGVFAQDVTTGASVTCNASGYSSAN